MLAGERHRERVVAPKEEARYLAAAPEPLASIATVLVDTGLRPEECFRLRWESINWANGRHGALLVTHGKTAAARRLLPMSPRVRAVLESRWNDAKKSDEGWVWPAQSRSGHVESCSLKRQHRRALQSSGVRTFVLYNLRHTFLTRLGESGCDAWTLARIAGHSSVGIPARYVHPSDDAVLNAISRLGGHKIRHTRQLTLPGAAENPVANLLGMNEKSGAPGEIRTPDPLVRSQMLYPAELRAREHILARTAPPCDVAHGHG